MFALTWRCDGSEGVMWKLLGIMDDGTFYGDIRFQTSHPSRRKARTVSGQLSPVERERMTELIAVICQLPQPAKPGPHFAALFERLPTRTDQGVRRLFEYHRGDECRSQEARAFLELTGLIERHLSPFYADVT